jgi:hypothetical protein
MRNESNMAIISALLMVLMMVMSSAVSPLTAYEGDQVLAGTEAAASGRVTGNEAISVSMVAGLMGTGYYPSGSTVSADISATNLDPNTNYTLEWGGTNPGYWGLPYGSPSSVNFTNVTSYTTSHSWASTNSTNGTQQVLWDAGWRIHANLYAQNSSGGSTLLTSAQSSAFTVGTSGVVSVSTGGVSLYRTGSYISGTVQANNFYSGIVKTLEYRWTTASNGSIISSGSQNFTSTYQSVTVPLPSNASNTPGNYNLSVWVFQMGYGIRDHFTIVTVVSVGTGNEGVVPSGPYSSYAVGSTVWANITAVQLDPNTNYTIVWGPANPAYGWGIVYGWTNTVNITGVTSYTATQSWLTSNNSTGNQTNGSQVLWPDSWRIHAYLYGSNNSANLLLADNETTTFAVGTDGVALAYIYGSTFVVGSSVGAYVYATACFYDIENRLEYEWHHPNGSVFSSGGQNFTGASNSFWANLPTSASNTPGYYTLTAKLYQVGVLIAQHSSSVQVVPVPGSGNETISVTVQQSSYTVGSTVWANISASNLDPNTNYTLEWEPIYAWGADAYYGASSTNIGGVSSYSTSYSWPTGNLVNGSAIWLGDWKIQAQLSSSITSLASGYSSNFTVSNATPILGVDVTGYGAVGTTATTTLYAWNMTVGETYYVYLNITDSSGSTVDFMDFSWNATQSSTSWAHSWYGLSPGSYCVNSYVESFNSSNYGIWDIDCFQMTAPPSVLQVLMWTNGGVGTTGSSVLSATNATVGETHWVMLNLTTLNGSIVQQKTFYWVANQSSSIWGHSWYGLSPGYYCVDAYVNSLNSSNAAWDSDCLYMTAPPTYPPQITVDASPNVPSGSVAFTVYAWYGALSTLYDVNWTLTDANGLLEDYGAMQYSGGSNSSWVFSWNGLAAGNHCLEANLYNQNGTFIDGNTKCFSVVNLTPTGYVNISLPGYSYTANAPFVVDVYAWNLNPAIYYQITWEINSGSATLLTGSDNFTGSTNIYMPQTAPGLSQGTYWISASLWTPNNWNSNGTLVDSYNFTFSVAGGGLPGCMDQTATNYDVNATVDDGSCVYPPPPPPPANNPPVCSIYIGSTNSTPVAVNLSYTTLIELTAGLHYVMASCSDADGDLIIVTMTNSSMSLSMSGIGNATVGSWVIIPAGFTGSVTLSVSWTDGTSLGSTVLTIQLLGGGSSSGGGGSSGGGTGGALPGFTSLLTITSMVGIALLRPRKRDE